MPHDRLPGWLREWRLDVGRRIREERERANLTQEGLAERLQTSRMTVVRIELGITSPQLDRILQIAHVLGLPPSRLLPDVPRPPDEGSSPTP